MSKKVSDKTIKELLEKTPTDKYLNVTTRKVVTLAGSYTKWNKKETEDYVYLEKQKLAGKLDDVKLALKELEIPEKEALSMAYTKDNKPKLVKNENGHQKAKLEMPLKDLNFYYEHRGKAGLVKKRSPMMSKKTHKKLSDKMLEAEKQGKVINVNNMDVSGTGVRKQDKPKKQGTNLQVEGLALVANSASKFKKALNLLKKEEYLTEKEVDEYLSQYNKLREECGKGKTITPKKSKRAKAVKTPPQSPKKSNPKKPTLFRGKRRKTPQDK